MTVIATLTVERPSGAWFDRARAYQIVVDGAVKGAVRCGRELKLALPPGTHTVRAKLDWTHSDDLPIHLGPGAEVRVRVEPRGPLHAVGRRYLRLTRLPDAPTG